MFEMLPQALALVSNSIQRDGCAVENLKIDVSQVNTTLYKLLTMRKSDTFVQYCKRLYTYGTL